MTYPFPKVSLLEKVLKIFRQVILITKTYQLWIIFKWRGNIPSFSIGSDGYLKYPSRSRRKTRVILDTLRFFETLIRILFFVRIPTLFLIVSKKYFYLFFLEGHFLPSLILVILARPTSAVLY